MDDLADDRVALLARRAIAEEAAVPCDEPCARATGCPGLETSAGSAVARRAVGRSVRIAACLPKAHSASAFSIGVKGLLGAAGSSGRTRWRGRGSWRGCRSPTCLQRPGQVPAVASDHAVLIQDGVQLGFVPLTVEYRRRRHPTATPSSPPSAYGRLSAESRATRRRTSRRTRRAAVLIPTKRSSTIILIGSSPSTCRWNCSAVR